MNHDDHLTEAEIAGIMGRSLLECSSRPVAARVLEPVMCESDECQFIGTHELTECCPGGEHLGLPTNDEPPSENR